MDSLIIPREIGNLFRLAMIPEFPSLFKHNPGDVFQDSYSCDDFCVHVLIATDKESFDEEVSLSSEELKFIDSRFQQSIGNWLMDKKARLGKDEITGNLDTLAKDIYGQYQVRSKDKEILLINLKSLNILTYNVWFKSENKEKEFYFRLIDSLEYDEESRGFVAILGVDVVGESLVPQVVNETYGKELGPYTTKAVQDIYPRQDRYEFNMRQYLATIKNNPVTILKTGGDYLLEQFGYLSHCKQFNQKYRNEIAEIMIERTYEKMAEKDYEVIIGRHNGNVEIKSVRKRFYSASMPKNLDSVTVPKQEMDAFVKELARFIKDTGGKTYTDDKMYISKAKQFIRQHTFSEVQRIYYAGRNAGWRFTFQDLKSISNNPVKPSLESSDDTYDD